MSENVVDLANLPLNPGIRRTVEWLNENGFETCDSGDGKTHDCECDRPYPYVVVVVSEPHFLASTANNLLKLLRTKLTIEPLNEKSDETSISVTAMYDPVDGFASIDVVNVTDETLFGAAQP